MWVFPQGDSGCMVCGCFLGRADCCAEDGYSSGETDCESIYVGLLLLYKTGTSVADLSRGEV